MRTISLLIAACLVLPLCGCDGEIWFSSGDDGWTWDTDQSGTPGQSAASAEGSTSTGGSSKTSKKTKTSDSSTPSKAQRLELVMGLPAQAKPAENFSVSLTVTNSTGAELKNLMVEGTLPNGMKVADSAGPATMHWKIPSLAAGEAKSFNINLKAPAEGNYTLKARATADGGKIASANGEIKITK